MFWRAQWRLGQLSPARDPLQKWVALGRQGSRNDTRNVFKKGIKGQVMVGITREFDVQDSINFSGCYPGYGSLVRSIALKMVDIYPVNPNARLQIRQLYQDHSASEKKTE
jgi:hypothetical protein